MFTALLFEHHDLGAASMVDNSCHYLRRRATAALGIPAIAGTQ
jgi:hypothetical protein